MKGRVIAFTQAPGHAALIVDGVLEDLLFSPKGDSPVVGDIRNAEVVRKLGGDTAVFVSMEGQTQGYLRDAKGLRAGNRLAVMVTALAEPGKALPVTRRLLIKGRYLILTPGAPGVNVSRQIRDQEERDRLTAAATSPTDDCGIIVRSAARDVDERTIKAERDLLASALPGADATTPVTRIATQSTPMSHALREWTKPQPELIAAPREMQSLLDWDTHPERFHFDRTLADALELGDGDPFDHFGVWDEIEKLRSPRADLPSGGWMAVEATRAMVTVDVNTGDGFGRGDAITANIEAVREIPRQLRLRGFGGQVIVDFAPLKKMHRKKIEEELKRAFRKCPVETSVAGWTPLGNMELTRKRERRPLSELLPR